MEEGEQGAAPSHSFTQPGSERALGQACQVACPEQDVGGRAAGPLGCLCGVLSFPRCPLEPGEWLGLCCNLHNFHFLLSTLLTSMFPVKLQHTGAALGAKLAQLQQAAKGVREEVAPKAARASQLRATHDRLATELQALAGAVVRLGGKARPASLVLRIVESSVAAEHVVPTCHACALQDNPELMAFCDVCQHYYHIHCLDPPLRRLPKKSKFRQWMCSGCDERFVFHTCTRPHTHTHTHTYTRTHTHSPQLTLTLNELSSNSEEEEETEAVVGPEAAGSAETRRSRRPPKPSAPYSPTKREADSATPDVPAHAPRKKQARVDSAAAHASTGTGRAPAMQNLRDSENQATSSSGIVWTTTMPAGKGAPAPPTSAAQGSPSAAAAAAHSAGAAARSPAMCLQIKGADAPPLEIDGTYELVMASPLFPTFAKHGQQGQYLFLAAPGRWVVALGPATLMYSGELAEHPGLVRAWYILKNGAYVPTASITVTPLV
jgi:hypothetical protein